MFMQPTKLQGGLSTADNLTYLADSCIYTLGIDKLPLNHQLNAVLSQNNDLVQNGYYQMAGSLSSCEWLLHNLSHYRLIAYSRWW